MPTATAIVVAAGEGRRIGGSVPKAYLSLGDRPILLRTLDRLAQCQWIRAVTLVIAENEFDRCKQLLLHDPKLSRSDIRIQKGGATRQQSVKNGLLSISNDSEIVLIHDGARPFASAVLFDRCIEEAAQKGAVTVGLPVRDTIKVVAQDRRIVSTPDRSTLWEIQTPQAFKREIIIAAHAGAGREGVEATDDAMLVERIGHPVWVLDGERTNIKITVPEDLWLAEMMVREGRVD